MHGSVYQILSISVAIIIDFTARRIAFACNVCICVCSYVFACPPLKMRP